MAEVGERVEEKAGMLSRRGAIRLAAGVAALGAGSVALAGCGSGVPGAYVVSSGGTLSAANAVTAKPTTMVSTSGGTYTLVAQGNDIWGTADHFTYYFATATADGTYSCKVKTEGTTSSDGGWAKAGLVARETGDASSPMVAVLITDKNGVAFQWRKTYKAAEESWPMAIAIGVTAPIWLKMAKSGSNWTVSYSTDGKTYNNKTSMSVPFTGKTYLIGLAACSHTPSAKTIDVFTNVQGFKPTMYEDVSPTNKKANSSSASG